MRKMTAQQERDVRKLQAEIKQNDKLMINGVFLTVLLMFACFIAATITGQMVLYQTIFMLAVGMVFWIARGDYLIHRAGDYIRTVEAQTESGWEKYLANLRSKPMLLIADLGSATGAAWLLYSSGKVLNAAGYGAFVTWSFGAVVFGIGFAIVATLMAQPSRL